jgi:hypothetical protein
MITYAQTLKDLANFVENQRPLFDNPPIDDLDMLPHD